MNQLSSVSFYVSSRVTTLHRTTLAAEILALHPPVVIAIIKPGEEETQSHYRIIIWTVCGLRLPFLSTTHPIWSWALMDLLEKKAILGKRRSWCMVNTLTTTRLGSHRWLMKRPMLPKSLASIQCTSPTCTCQVMNVSNCKWMWWGRKSSHYPYLNNTDVVKTTHTFYL